MICCLHATVSNFVTRTVISRQTVLHWNKNTNCNESVRFLSFCSMVRLGVGPHLRVIQPCIATMFIQVSRKRYHEVVPQRRAIGTVIRRRCKR